MTFDQAEEFAKTLEHEDLICAFAGNEAALEMLRKNWKDRITRSKARMVIRALEHKTIDFAKAYEYIESL